MKLKIFIILAFIAFNFSFGQKGYYERWITDEGGVLKPGQPVIINGNSGTFMALNFQFKYIRLSILYLGTADLAHIKKNIPPKNLIANI